MRRASAVLVAIAIAMSGIATPVAAQAAEAPRLVVDRPDPLRSDPIELTIAALAPSGSATAFSGTAVLAVGKAAVSVPMRAAADSAATVSLPTTTLKAGWATLRLRARVGGRAVAVTLPAFAEIVPTLSVRGFGCAAVTAGGGTLRWAVDRIGGMPVAAPNARDVPLLPYVRSSAARWSMTGADGLPLRTSGSIVVRSAAGKTVARLVLPEQVRRLVFGVRWNGRASGAFRAGEYTAVLALRDPSGRTVTAEQRVSAVAKGSGPCGS